MTLAERVSELSDLAAVDVCEQLAAAAIKDVSVAAVLDDLPPDMDRRALENGLDEQYYDALPPELSIKLARSMLDAAVHDEMMAPKLTAILDNRKDTKQFALEVLSIGAAISMVIMAATSTYGSGGFGKQPLSPELADKLGRWLDSLKPWFKSPENSGT